MPHVVTERQADFKVNKQTGLITLSKSVKKKPVLCPVRGRNGRLEKETQRIDKKSKLFLHLKKWLEKAVLDYSMIGEGDKLLIGVSGGADSFALLDLLDSPMIFVPKFSFIAVNIDMGFDPDYIAYRELENTSSKSISVRNGKTEIGVLSHSDFNRKKHAFCARAFVANEFLKSRPKMAVTRLLCPSPR